MTDDTELLNTLILTRLSYFHLNAVIELYRRLGSATAVVALAPEIRTHFPNIPQRLSDAFSDIDMLRSRAEAELIYCREHNVQILCFNDKNYPQRLRNCPDAPLLLFYKGTANLNQEHIINIVGTRKCTTYGQDIIRRFVADLHSLCPDTLIVSGLAYGVDIHAQRNALQNGLETVAVLAHGLDDLYPPRHRDTANEMILHGGLLTEFMTRTNADKLNFIRRNRITAGISDACILVESARKGGGLITARISQEYHRDVFAFPGRTDAVYSEGCNRLIRNNGATLITSAEDFVESMGWQDNRKLNAARSKGIERELFPDLSEEEKKIVSILQQTNDLQINILSIKADMPIGKITSLLFDMEMKGIVKPYAGGTYHLLD